MRQKKVELVMPEAPVVLASEIPDCPPHLWDIGSDMLGVCRKCGVVKEFPREGSTVIVRKELQFKRLEGGKKVRQFGIVLPTRRANPVF